MPNSKPHFMDRLGYKSLIFAWVIFFVVATLLANVFLQRMENPNQTLVSTTDSKGMIEVILQRNRYGHYVASGQINNQPVIFMLDTGATHVSVPESVAKRLDLARGMAYNVSTANGTATVYHTQLQSLSIGDIKWHHVTASITPTMQGDQVLLGMNILKQLEMIQKGDQLILRVVNE